MYLSSMYLINHEKILKNVKFLPSCGSVALGLQEFPKNKPKITNWVEVSLKEISNLNYDSSFISKKLFLPYLPVCFVKKYTVFFGDRLKPERIWTKLNIVARHPSYFLTPSTDISLELLLCDHLSFNTLANTSNIPHRNKVRINTSILWQERVKRERRSAWVSNS